MFSPGIANVSRRYAMILNSKKEKSSKPNLLKPRKTLYNLGSTNIEFGRKLGSKDKKKRKVIDNGPQADGQAPMNEIGQQRTGYKYYRKRRALGFIGATGVLGGITGAALGGTAGILLKNPNKGAMIGAGLGAAAGSGASLIEHMGNKHSPFYKKKK